jgi:hypothetical protein
MLASPFIKLRTSSTFPAADARWRRVSPAWLRRLIFEDGGFADTRGDVNGGLMDDGGGMDSEEQVDKLDTVVDADDSLD